MSNLITPQLTSLRKTAMKTKNKTEKAVYVALSSAFQRYRMDQKIEILTEKQEMSILVKQISQRKESLSLFTKAERFDLAEVEKAELEVLSRHLPKQISESDISDLILKAIESVKTDLGHEVKKDDMKLVMIKLSDLKGKADMGKISGTVRSMLD